MCEAASAQSAAQFITWGDRAMAVGDRYGASRYYGEALKTDPGILETQWKYAEACRLSNQYREAAKYYDRVEHKDRGVRHPGALRWLAEMQMSTGDYDEAEKTWAKVKRKAGRKDAVVAQRATNALEGCRMAKGMQAAAPPPLELEHLPAPVNSPGSEFGARSGPDSALYFTALRGEVNKDGAVQDTSSYHARIFRTREVAGKWAEPQPVELPGRAARNRANSAWSLDGKWFYFSQGDGNGMFSIMAVERDRPAAQAVRVLGGDGMNCTQPMVAKVNGVQTMFFTEAGPKGGGLDIWSCIITGAKASDAQPLGSPVDTPGNESCPFFDAKENILWFSSDFLPGLGGYDIFKSTLVPSGFSKPENAGLPLNSPANDLYPSTDAFTGDGWITSNRAGSFSGTGETCCNDLFRYRTTRITPPVDTLVADSAITAKAGAKRILSLREKLPVRLYFHNDEPDPRSWDTTTTQDYAETYSSYAAKRAEYDSAWHAAPTDTTAFDRFFTAQVQQGFDQLNQFTALLKQALDAGQDITLQVRGYASPLAKSNYNLNLSLRRIASLIFYLRKTDNGSLAPYMDGTATNGGRLRIVKKPFGKSEADTAVSDRLDDLRHSVYSVGAARERRIEIEEVN